MRDAALVTMTVCNSVFIVWGSITVGRMFGLIGDGRLGRFMRAVRSEVHPFVLPIVVIEFLAQVYVESADHPYLNKWAVLGLVSNALCWWFNRQDDDDRWKRRRDRVAGRVRELASGRLVVVPVRGGS